MYIPRSEDCGENRVKHEVESEGTRGGGVREPGSSTTVDIPRKWWSHINAVGVEVYSTKVATN